MFADLTVITLVSYLVMISMVAYAILLTVASSQARKQIHHEQSEMDKMVDNVLMAFKRTRSCRGALNRLIIQAHEDCPTFYPIVNEVVSAKGDLTANRLGRLIEHNINAGRVGGILTALDANLYRSQALGLLGTVTGILINCALLASGEADQLQMMMGVGIACGTTALAIVACLIDDSAIRPSQATADRAVAWAHDIFTSLANCLEQSALTPDQENNETQISIRTTRGETDGNQDESRTGAEHDSRRYVPSTGDSAHVDDRNE